nr:hypothetical protein [Candidatus Sigynarchaeota archaeon]
MSIDIILTFLSTTPMIISACFGFYKYAKGKERERSFLFFAITCLFFFLSFLTWAIAQLFDDMSIAATYAPIFGVFSSIALVFHTDAISRDTVDPRKLVILAVLATGALLKGEVYYQNYIFLMLLQIYSIIMWTYYAWKIHVNAPAHIKRRSQFYLIGVIIFAAGSLWGSMANAVTMMNPGLVLLEILKDYIRWELILGSAFMLITVEFARMPILVNILPSNALRLSVIDISNGISLYTYNWVRRDVPLSEDLFSSMFSGISIILNESVQQGNIREIQLDKAKLIMKQSGAPFNVVFVLIASKSTKALRNALDSFATKFLSRFSNEIGKDNEKSKYSTSIEFIRECFPFAID